MKSEISNWMTVSSAAEYVGCHPEVLRRWVRDGKLQGEGVGKLGWVYRFKKEALDRFVEFKPKRKR